MFRALRVNKDRQVKLNPRSLISSVVGQMLKVQNPNNVIIPSRKLTLVGLAQLLNNRALVNSLVEQGGQLQDVSKQAPLSAEEVRAAQATMPDVALVPAPIAAPVSEATSSSSTASTSSMDLLAEKPVAKQFESADPYAKLTVEGLQSVFKSDDENDLEKTELLINKLVAANSLEFLDAQLPVLIKDKKYKTVLMVLKTNVSMQSLMTAESAEVLAKLDAGFATQLTKAAESRHPAIAYRIKRITILDRNSMIRDALESDELEELLSDPVNFQLFHEPTILPEGQTFSQSEIIKYKENPLTRNAIKVSDFRPNLLITDLLAFLMRNPVASETLPPMFLSLVTQLPMEHPVVAENGVTYEAKELEDYRKAHPGELLKPAYPNLSLSACYEYCKKHLVFAEKAADVEPEAQNAVNVTPK